MTTNTTVSNPVTVSGTVKPAKSVSLIGAILAAGQKVESVHANLDACKSTLKEKVTSLLDEMVKAEISIEGNWESILARKENSLTNGIMESFKAGKTPTSTQMDAVKECQTVRAYFQNEAHKVSNQTCNVYCSEYRKAILAKSNAEDKAQKLEIPVEVAAKYESLKDDINKVKVQLEKLGYRLNFSLQGVKPIPAKPTAKIEPAKPVKTPKPVKPAKVNK